MIYRLWNSPVFTSWGSLLVKVAGLSLLLPFALRTLPTSDANLWLVFSAFAGFLLLADFGLSPTFIRAVAYGRAYEHHSEPPDAAHLRDTYSIGHVVAVLRVVYRRLALIAFMTAAIVGSLIVAKPISESSSAAQGWLAWSAVTIGAYFSFKGNMYAAYLQGMERIPEMRRWEILMGSLSLTASVVVLLAGGGVLAVVLVTQAGIVGTSLINGWLARRVSEDKSLWDASPQWSSKVWGEVWPAAWRSGLGVAASAGTVQGAGLIYAQIATPNQVAPYLLAMRLMQSLVLLANVPFYTKIPALSRLFAEGKLGAVKSLALAGIGRANLVLLLGGMGTYYLAEPLLRLLGSKTDFVSPSLWMLICLANAFHRVGAMHLQLYATTNKILFHFADGVAGVLILLATIYFYRKFGIYGLPLGSIIGFGFFYMPFGIWCARREFKSNFTMRNAVKVFGAIFVFLFFSTLLIFE